VKLQTLANVLNSQFDGCLCDVDVSARITKAGDLVVTIGKETRTLKKGQGRTTVALADWFSGFEKERVDAVAGFHLGIGNRDVSLDDRGELLGAGTGL
jgi:hypothetical protein